MYNGFLIKLGDYIVPKRYMQSGSYNTSLGVIDVDSGRNANGKLVRNALEDRKNVAEFMTPLNMIEADKKDLFDNVAANYIIPKERKLLATLWVPEISDYMTQEVYLQDPQITINHDFTDEYEGELYYQPIKMAFTAY